MPNMQEYLSKFVNSTVSIVTESNNHIQGELLDVGEDYVLIDQSPSPQDPRAVVVPMQVVDSIQLTGTRQQLMMRPLPERSAAEDKSAVKPPQPTPTPIRRR